jgi:hypothetical protein
VRLGCCAQLAAHLCGTITDRARRVGRSVGPQPARGSGAADNCLTDQSATRCQGQILVSHDGGARWTTVLAGGGPVFATANDTGQLWAAETMPGTGGELRSGITFLTSTNGGHSWQPLGQFDNGVPVTPQIQIHFAASRGGLAWTSLSTSEAARCMAAGPPHCSRARMAAGPGAG